MGETTTFLPDPLEKKAEKPDQEDERTIEEERREALEQYQNLLIESSKREEEPTELRLEDELKAKERERESTHKKEEPLPEEVAHDVAISEATAGKKLPVRNLPKFIPVKTIRLSLDKFNSFYGKKYFKVKLDYDLYFEVNGENQKECIDKIMDFVEVELKGMLLDELDEKLGDEHTPASKEEFVSGGKNGRHLKLKKEDIEIEEFIPEIRTGENQEYIF